MSVEIIHQVNPVKLFVSALAILCNLDFNKKSSVNYEPERAKVNQLYVIFATDGYKPDVDDKCNILTYTSSFDLLWEVKEDCCDSDMFLEFFQCAYKLLKCIKKDRNKELSEHFHRQNYQKIEFSSEKRKLVKPCVQHKVRVKLTWCPCDLPIDVKGKLKDVKIKHCC